MIVKLMGLLDLATTIAILLLHYNIIEAGSMMFFIVYLSIKTIGFWGDFASKLDGLCVAYIILMILGLKSFFVFIIVIYLGQKALFSLLA